MWVTMTCLALCRTSWGISCPSFLSLWTTTISGVLVDPGDLLLPAASFLAPYRPLAYHDVHGHADELDGPASWMSALMPHMCSTAGGSLLIQASPPPGTSV